MLAFTFISTVSSQSTTDNNNGFGNKYLGYSNNFPLLFKTNFINRLKLNGNTNYSIDGYNGNRNGNLLLGWQNTGTLYNTNRGAYSLLHLNGEGTLLQEGGYRSWMKTGITFTGNNDMSYMGIRKVGTSTDITETTITWSDNQGTSSVGPDDMVFRFTGSGSGTTLISSDLETVNDLDGLHIARFVATALK